MITTYARLSPMFALTPTFTSDSICLLLDVIMICHVDLIAGRYCSATKSSKGRTTRKLQHFMRTLLATGKIKSEPDSNSNMTNARWLDWSVFYDIVLEARSLNLAEKTFYVTE